MDQRPLGLGSQAASWHSPVYNRLQATLHGMKLRLRRVHRDPWGQKLGRWRASFNSSAHLTGGSGLPATTCRQSSHRLSILYAEPGPEDPCSYKRKENTSTCWGQRAPLEQVAAHPSWKALCTLELKGQAAKFLHKILEVARTCITGSTPILLPPLGLQQHKTLGLRCARFSVV